MFQSIVDNGAYYLDLNQVYHALQYSCKEHHWCQSEYLQYSSSRTDLPCTPATNNAGQKYLLLIISYVRAKPINCLPEMSVAIANNLGCYHSRLQTLKDCRERVMKKLAAEHSKFLIRGMFSGCWIDKVSKTFIYIWVWRWYNSLFGMARNPITTTASWWPRRVVLWTFPIDI